MRDSGILTQCRARAYGSRQAAWRDSQPRARLAPLVRAFVLPTSSSWADACAVRARCLRGHVAEMFQLGNSRRRPLPPTIPASFVGRAPFVDDVFTLSSSAYPWIGKLAIAHFATEMGRWEKLATPAARWGVLSIRRLGPRIYEDNNGRVVTVGRTRQGMRCVFKSHQGIRFALLLPLARGPYGTYTGRGSIFRLPGSPSGSARLWTYEGKAPVSGAFRSWPSEDTAGEVETRR
ncbi:hypothetical protein GLOTRDRAFT_96956 [Gloeophyllum trabeum ATCC 11539]|uniref:Uncharacterized protein n=1 Tax=Gloeophyllum trabeum (strain ATCC 11539 / FP-39264 / Madison 617) TaxID=670483 RepID=S7PRH3_GLOTA|nr:uncharacterized protein GLOTRDRAFT_96956 [Gloeophyllum trabeum ATCC 11539]EPQ50456.1 hypothetical protein GLOTRDRAFT_96956 [Gloeophyllum trabeum ATCC 11539]